jgi:cysteine/O-acetylserine efflux protein
MVMADNIVPLLSFVLISTFTPGPNNISSASMGVLHGYKNTLTYQVGMAAGVFCVMLLSGWVSTSLLNFFPVFESMLRIIGAGYILYLAFGILKTSYTFNENNLKPMGFAQGLMLQILNPKLLVYGLTLFTAFLAPITTNLALLVLTAIFLTAIAFCATSSWALFGTTIKTYLHQPQVKAIVNIILALSLVYTAIELIGII